MPVTLRSRNRTYAAALPELTEGPVEPEVSRHFRFQDDWRRLRRQYDENEGALSLYLFYRLIRDLEHIIREEYPHE